ncbi:hypothetical protein HZB96_04630 [Candidatus Gottesmanbacteria bacterium]|nr:hypothetical protein [Candidatus Gottesmanbacteria bacterium]
MAVLLEGRDYAVSMEFARIHREEFGKGSEVFSDHTNPVTGKTCKGPLIIDYFSIRSPVAQETLDLFGVIPSTCLSCGVSADIGQNGQIVPESIV